MGKVTLSMLLHRYGEVLGRVYVLVRTGSSTSAERRFFDKVAPSEPFQPLRDHHGDEAARGVRPRAVRGPRRRHHRSAASGLSDGAARRRSPARWTSSSTAPGLVSFNPSLEVGLNVNTHGVRNAVELCLRSGAPLVHMSTAFVAGNRSGLVFEDEEIARLLPHARASWTGATSRWSSELTTRALVARLREQADDHALTSSFRKHARWSGWRRKAATPRTRRRCGWRWAASASCGSPSELTEAGMERAPHWGWPNTYTYTKSLGEQVIAGTPDLRYAIVRPAIVESALRFPFPGWNEGFTTSAPLAFVGLKGHRAHPRRRAGLLDIIPVDLVAGSLIAITARALADARAARLPAGLGRLEPVLRHALGRAGRPLPPPATTASKETGSALINDVQSRARAVAGLEAQRSIARSAPLFAAGARLLRQGIDETTGRAGARPGSRRCSSGRRSSWSEVEEQAGSLSSLIDLFLPFIWENRYVFRCDNTRSLYARMDPLGRGEDPLGPRTASTGGATSSRSTCPAWRSGCSPASRRRREKRKAIHAHRDLLELFDAAVHAYRHRVAFRRVEGEREERFTYGEVHR